MEENITIMQCMLDDEFQQILQKDEVLNELEAQKNNKVDQYFELSCILFKRFKIAGITCIPITPIIWCFLYCIKNKIVCGGEVNKDDVDQFMYLLHNGIEVLDEDFLKKAHGFCVENDIDYTYALNEIIDMIKLTFRPLEMFPRPSIKDQDVRFNVDWLTKIVGMACKVCNKTSDEVMMNMSLCEALYYVVQYSREGDVDNNIKRRNSDQINEAIYLRTMQLGKQYYQNNYKGK